MTRGALEGIRVLEWALIHAGPHAGSILGDLGAEVIKIEDRVRGDPTRGFKKVMGVPVVSPQGRSYAFELHNRNKKGITLDLKQERGREVLYRLVEKSDVFLSNYRRDVAKRLGVDYPTLHRHNPRLIYAWGSGFGPEGPDAESRGQDFPGQARAGIMMAQRSTDDTPFSPVGLGDQMTSIALAFGIVTALVARERLGLGQEVDTSLLGGMTWLQTTNLGYTLFTGQELKPWDRKRVANPLLNNYRAGDGLWLCLGMGAMSDSYWPGFCQALGIQELEKDPRFENIDRREEHAEELISILEGIFARQPRDHWLKKLKEYDLVFSPVNRLTDLATDPQVVENEYIIDYDHPVLGKVKLLGFPIRFGETPAQVLRPAPEHGEHTEQVLLEIAGYSWQEIEELKDLGII